MKLPRGWAAVTLLLTTTTTLAITETSAHADEPEGKSTGTAAGAGTGAGAGAAIAVAPPNANVNVSGGGGTPMPMPILVHEESKPTLLPIVLAGTGLALVAVGTILIVAAPDTPPTCKEDLRTCVRQPGESAEDFSNDQDRAGRAHTMPIGGWLTIGLGGMLVAAGALTYLFGPEGRHTGARARLTPYAGPNGGGLTAVGTF